MKEFQVGDVVILNSGGPPMTVTDTIDNMGADVDCTWIDGGGKHEHRFSSYALKEFKSGLPMRAKK